MKIELQKTESSWLQSSLGCYISLDGTLLDVVTPLNNPHEVSFIETVQQGTLKLVIRDMGRHDGYLGSVSIPTSLLETSQSPVTLPLFDSLSSDLITHVPEVPCPPRITLVMQDRKSTRLNSSH